MKERFLSIIQWLVRGFDRVVKFLTDNIIVVKFEEWAGWMGSYPLLFGQIFLYLFIAWGILGGELGLTDLYWTDSWPGQLGAGLATCWLFGVVVFINYLLQTPKDLPGTASDTDRGYRTLFPSRNPGIRRVGLWMMTWLLALLALLYVGKLVAIAVDVPDSTSAGQAITSFLVDRGYTLMYAIGYALGLLLAFTISYFDSRLELREQLAESAILKRPFQERAVPIPAGRRDPQKGGSLESTVVQKDSVRPTEERFVVVQSYEMKDAIPSRTPTPAAAPPIASEATVPPVIETPATALRSDVTDAEMAMALNNLLTIRLLHAMGLLVGLFSLMLIALVSIYTRFYVASPLIVLSLLLIVADVFGGFIAFRGTATKSLAVLALAVLLLLNWQRLVGNKMSFPNIHTPDQYDLVIGNDNAYAELVKEPEDGLIRADDWLKKFAGVRGVPAQPGAKPRLVLIATSGGGIRAAVWTGVVLEQLENRSALNTHQFRNHIGLIAGASGGMVGAGAYVGNFRNGPLTAGAEGQLGPLSRALAADSLSHVVQTMLLRDFTTNMLWPFPTESDRGRSLEKSWKENFQVSGHQVWNEEPPLSIPFRSLKKDEAEWKRPSLVFSPMMVEDSKRLLVSNHDLQALTKPQSYRLASQAAHALPAVEFFRLFPGAVNFEVGTAARMSATFPVVSPAVSLPVLPPRRIVDAGYFDNYGVDVLCQWLLVNKKAVVANTSGVLIVQIRAYPLEDEGGQFRKVAPSGVQLLAGAISAPLEALMTARGAAAYHRNAEALASVGRAYAFTEEGKKLSADFLATVALEMDGAAALSWYLTEDQKAAVARGTVKLRPQFEAIEAWFGNGRKD